MCGYEQVQGHHFDGSSISSSPVTNDITIRIVFVLQNAIRELSRRMQSSNGAHRKAMLRAVKYCIDTRERGWMLKPTRK